MVSTRFVSDDHRDSQIVRIGRSSLGESDIRTTNDEVFNSKGLDVIAQHIPRVKMVNRNLEEPLNLR